MDTSKVNGERAQRPDIGAIKKIQEILKLSHRQKNKKAEKEPKRTKGYFYRERVQDFGARRNAIRHRLKPKKRKDLRLKRGA